MTVRKICLVSWVPLRKEPSSTSEMVSSLLFGETCTVVSQEGEWLSVLCDHDQYPGFIPEKYLADESIILPENHVKWLNYGPVIARPVLPEEESENFNGPIILSPGSWVSSSGVLDIQGIEYYFHATSTLFDSRKFLKQFINTPYLWGGRSIFGIDCSGLTQLYTAAQGISIPRDAYQQIELGQPVDFLEKQEGDLAFFQNKSGKITHVGIVLNGGQIIHASNQVRVDLLSKIGITHCNTQELTHELVEIRRIKLTE